jgi:hypothetical protein
MQGFDVPLFETIFSLAKRLVVRLQENLAKADDHLVADFWRNQIKRASKPCH